MFVVCSYISVSVCVCVCMCVCVCVCATLLIYGMIPCMDTLIFTGWSKCHEELQYNK